MYALLCLYTLWLMLRTKLKNVLFANDFLKIIPILFSRQARALFIGSITVKGRIDRELNKQSLKLHT